MADFVPGRAMIDVAQRKRDTYMAKCAAIGYGFLPFSFSSSGELEADAVTLLKRIRKFFMAQDIRTRVVVHIFNRISIAIAKGIELHETQLVVKQFHSVRMPWFEQLETHLSNLYHNKLSRAADAFKPAFLAFFGIEHQTFRLKMFHNLDQLKLQFKRENLHEVHAKTCLEVLRLQFKEYFTSPAVNSSDHLSQCWQDTFNMYMYCDPETYKRNLIEYLDMLVDVLHESVLQYGILCMKENEVNALKENGRQLNDEILHEHQIKKSFKLQSQDVQINPIQAVDDSLIVSKSSLIETENNNALSKSENETQL
ncbi:hypothetical protein Tco_1177544 [Tanacetum coccineum]